MTPKQSNSAPSNIHGFTLVELIMVIGILGMLAAIAVQQLKINRQNAYDSQVVSTVRNLLTVVAIDEPTGVTTGPNPTPNLAAVGLPQVEVPKNVTWYALNVNSLGNNQHDMWMFWFAHPAGKRGYYFWIPGDACNATEDSVAGDDSGNSSDYIFYDEDTGSGSPYRTMAGI